VGTPWGAGGAPTNDSLRFAFMSGTENVDSDGFVNAAPHGSDGDYVQWCSVGPFLHVPDGGSVHATIAFAVQNGTYAGATQYAADYQSFRNHQLSANALLAQYPVLPVALKLENTFDGVYERRLPFPVPDWHGRETALKLPPGAPPQFAADCRDVINDREFTWFDFDCDYCTGVWDYPTTSGIFHHTWRLAPAPTLDAPLAPLVALGAARAAPNPSSRGVRLEFDLAARAPVRVSILDLAGRVIRELAGERLEAGRNSVWWDGNDRNGVPARAGVYLYRVHAGARTLSGQLVVVH
jgi:hypothetical protein